MKIYKSVDEYINSFSGVTKEKLIQLRVLIKETAPKSEQVMSYGMAAFKQGGILVFIGGFKDHVSLFPASAGVSKFNKELKKYKTSKGTIQFQLDKPLPEELIKKIVKFKVDENLKKA